MSDETECGQQVRISLKGEVGASKAKLHEKARQSALEKDAQRYRWLRDKGSKTWVPLSSQWRMAPAMCDATIDAAMQYT